MNAPGTPKRITFLFINSESKKSILDMLAIFKKDLAKLELAIKKEDSKFLYNLFSKTRLIRKKINK